MVVHTSQSSILSAETQFVPLAASRIQVLINHLVVETHPARSANQGKRLIRTRTGQEVDIVLENQAGEIEVKASSTVNSRDFKGLKYLNELLGDRFLRGIVLYTGDEAVPFSSNLYALPVSTLWRDNEMPTEMSESVS